MPERKRAPVYQIVFEHLRARHKEQVTGWEDARAFLEQSVQFHQGFDGKPVNVDALHFMKIDTVGAGVNRLKARLAQDITDKQFKGAGRIYRLPYILDGLRVCESGKSSKGRATFMFYNPKARAHQVFLPVDNKIDAGAQILYNDGGSKEGSSQSIADMIQQALKITTGAKNFRLAIDRKPGKPGTDSGASSSEIDGSDEDKELEANKKDRVIGADFTPDERIAKLQTLFRELAPDDQPVALMRMCTTMDAERQAGFCESLCRRLGRAPPAAKPAPATAPEASTAGPGLPALSLRGTSLPGTSLPGTSQSGSSAPGISAPGPDAAKDKPLVANPVLTSARGPGDLENLRKLFLSLPSTMQERQVDLGGHAWRLLGTMATLPGWLPVHATSLKDERNLYTTAVPPSVSRLLKDARLSCNVYYMLVALGGGNTVLAYLVLHLYRKMQSRTAINTGDPGSYVVNRSAAVVRTRQAVMDILPLLRLAPFREQMGLGFLPLRPWEEGYQIWLRRYAPSLDGLAPMIRGVWDYLVDTVHMSAMETRFIMNWVMAVVHTNFGPVQILPARHFLTRLLTKNRFPAFDDTFYLVSFTVDQPNTIKKGCPMLDLPEFSLYRPDLRFRRVETRQGLVVVPDLQATYENVVFALGRKDAAPAQQAPAAPDDDPRVFVTYSCLVDGSARTFDILGKRSVVLAHLADPVMYTPEGFARAQAEFRKTSELRRQALAPAPTPAPAPALAQCARPKRARAEDQPSENPAKPAEKASRKKATIQSVPSKPAAKSKPAPKPVEPPRVDKGEIHRATFAGWCVPPGEKRTRRPPQ